MLRGGARRGTKLIPVSCPICRTGLGPGDVTSGLYHCPRCGAWLRTSRYVDAVYGLVPLLLSGLSAYLLGLRGFPLLMVSLLGFWIFLVPVGALLSRVFPVRLKRSWPDFGTLGLFDTRGPQPNPGGEEKQDQRQGDTRDGS